MKESSVLNALIFSNYRGLERATPVMPLIRPLPTAQKLLSQFVIYVERDINL